MRVPPVWPGMRVGLLGGSFNPPHAGHRHLSLTAMKRAGLDRVWWLVTPGNPLKDKTVLAPLDDRIAAARKLADHPRIDVTAFEASRGSAYTVDTLHYLTGAFAGVDFVFLIGADNLASLHRWRRWRDIAAMVPLIVVDRPGPGLSALAAPAPTTLARYRLDEREAARLPRLKPPAWTFLTGPRVDLSSTQLRAAAASAK
ncbi:MAG: nicotinate-nucleotide adenylyltransferase [Hyphomicrobiales bacterium]